MSAGTVAAVYATALLELADERGKRPAVVEDCRRLSVALEAALIARLDDPKLGKSQAKSVLAASLGSQVEPEVLDLLHLLVDRNRLTDARSIVATAVELAEAQAGLVRVQVTTAVPLSSAAADSLAQALRRALGPGVALSTTVDDSLIGGMTLRVADRFVDGSVRRRLHELKQRILEAPLPDGLWVN